MVFLTEIFSRSYRRRHFLIAVLDLDARVRSPACSGYFFSFHLWYYFVLAVFVVQGVNIAVCTDTIG